jgi:hypothetical protein
MALLLQIQLVLYGWLCWRIYPHARPRVAPFCRGEALLAKTEASATAGKARKGNNFR